MLIEKAKPIRPLDHGRWSLPVIPTTMPDMPHNWYVTAQKTA